MSSLSVFLAPALDLDPAAPDLDQSLFGELSLDALEVLCETWARHLDPYWIKAKTAVRASIQEDRAAGYISLDEVTWELERDMFAAERLRMKMRDTHERLLSTQLQDPRLVASRISTVLVTL